ncbi:MAG: serine/threonine-protein kinase [Myxococcota bacterium]|nr:serine/threonine-protein kinase [Myxococcota bacterium]
MSSNLQNQMTKRINGLNDHITPNDVAGARKENRGKIIRDGQGHIKDHVGEVKQERAAIEQMFVKLNKRLGELDARHQKDSAEYKLLSEFFDDLEKTYRMSNFTQGQLYQAHSKKLDDMRLGERLNHGMHSNVYALGDKQVAVVLKAQDALASEAQNISKHFRAQIDYMHKVNELEFEGSQIGPKIERLMHDAEGHVVGYVAERIQGEELATLAQRGELSDAQFSEVLRQIDGQRQVLHAAGLIHGDPNKSNILVGVDKAGAVKVSLIDFEPANSAFGVSEDAAMFDRTVKEVELLRRPENVRDFLAKEQEQARAVKTGDFLRTERPHIEALRSELRDLRKVLRAADQDTSAVNAMLGTLALEGKEARLWSAEDFKQVGEKLAQDGVLEELKSLGGAGESLSQKLEITLARWR